MICFISLSDGILVFTGAYESIGRLCLYLIILRNAFEYSCDRSTKYKKMAIKPYFLTALAV